MKLEAKIGFIDVSKRDSLQLLSKLLGHLFIFSRKHVSYLRLAGSLYCSTVVPTHMFYCVIYTVFV